jgi:hypothetical protein
MYHAYNLIDLDTPGEIGIQRLPVMLEGQVAVLSSGSLATDESIELIESMFDSALYREDQDSFMLYPDREIEAFPLKNTLSAEQVNSSELVRALMAEGNRDILEKDVTGNYHFNGNFNNVNDLTEALNQLPDTYADLVKTERDAISQLFEDTFKHRFFTGRSGTFFGYEGLGSIYWHMNSKLLLAVQENLYAVSDTDSAKEKIRKLYDLYHRIKEGIGVHKAPDHYGAFPIDPYSHTPGGKGAQQPGMTGQVKEDILSRMGELGVCVDRGGIQFSGALLDRNELLDDVQQFGYFDIHGSFKELKLEKGSLAFLLLQVPVTYRYGEEDSIVIHWNDGSKETLHGRHLNAEKGAHLFQRNGRILRLDVQFAQ